MPIYALGDVQPTLPDEGEYWVAPDAQVMGNVTLAQECQRLVWRRAARRQ